MKIKRLFYWALCILTVLMCMSLTAYADIGPKASVHIIFENMGDELCYGTLLSETDCTGPAAVWDGKDENARHNENEYYSYSELNFDIWKAFVDYKDTDGYYFLQSGWKVSENKELAWTYYPPHSFKILLYYPESEKFAVSGIYERYAFDTYYTVNMQGIEIGTVDYNETLSTDERIEQFEASTRQELTAEKSYDYSKELLSLFARIVITIIIETAVALIFGFRKKNELIFLSAVNIITQIILNVLLNAVNFTSGYLAFTYNYIFFEIIVFALEALLYSAFMKKLGSKERKARFYIIYSFVANAVSFGAGFIAAKIIPGIF